MYGYTQKRLKEMFRSSLYELRIFQSYVELCWMELIQKVNSFVRFSKLKSIRKQFFSIITLGLTQTYLNVPPGGEYAKHLVLGNS